MIEKRPDETKLAHAWAKKWHAACERYQHLPRGSEAELGSLEVNFVRDGNWTIGQHLL